VKRKAEVLAPTDLGAASTKVIDIDIKSQISRLTIWFTVDNVTVSVMLAELRKVISKIELIDGGRVLASVPATVLAGINFYSEGVMPYTTVGLTVGNTATAVVHLDFGRFLWDAEYAFRPEMFSNPQLRITHNEAAWNTNAVVNSFAVHAHVDDSPPQGGAGGMLVTKEVQNYGFTASATEVIRIPTDQTIRGIFVVSESTDHDLLAGLDTVKLDVNSGQFVFFNEKVESLFQELVRLGPVTIPVTLDSAVSAMTLYLPTTQGNQLAIAYDAVNFVTAQSHFSVVTATGPKLAITASVDIQAETAVATGYAPGGVIPFWQGNPHDPETWYTPNASDQLRASILASAVSDSSDTGRVIVQQAIRY
jgi:hypothetical protein